MSERLKIRAIDALTVAVLVLASWRLWSVARPTEPDDARVTPPNVVPASAVASLWDSLVVLSDGLSSQWDDEGIIMVSDFECEYCRRSVPSVDSALAHGIGVRYLHLTRGAGTKSDEAARFAYCGASEADPFVDRYRRLMTTETWRKSSFGDEVVTPQMNECMTSAKTTAKLQASRSLANLLGVRGTPMFISKQGVLYGQSGFEAIRTLASDGKAVDQRGDGKVPGTLSR
jgi:hypothetical protein